jgi:hypothetical protein
MRIISFRTADFSFIAEFNDSAAARALISGMPISSFISTWGDEIYFDTGIDTPADGAAVEVSVGDVAYWPAGKSLCIFFGRTPASRGTDKPVPASPVVIVGKTGASPEELRTIPANQEIIVSLAD